MVSAEKATHKPHRIASIELSAFLVNYLKSGDFLSQDKSHYLKDQNRAGAKKAGIWSFPLPSSLNFFNPIIKSPLEWFPFDSAGFLRQSECE